MKKTATELAMALCDIQRVQHDLASGYHVQFARDYHASGLSPQAMLQTPVSIQMNHYLESFAGWLARSLLIAFRDDHPADSWRHLQSIECLSRSLPDAPDVLARLVFLELNGAEILDFWHRSKSHGIDLSRLTARLRTQHVNSMNSDGRFMRPCAPEQRAISKLLITEPLHAEAFATRILENCLKVMLRIHHKNDQPQIASREIDHTFDHLEAVMPLADPKSLSNLVGNSVADFAKHYTRTPGVPIHQASNSSPALAHFLQHLDRLGIPWRDCLAETLGAQTAPENAGCAQLKLLNTLGCRLADLDTLSNTEYLVTTVIIQQASMDDLIKLFSKRSSILAAIYEVRQDKRLLPLMHGHERRKSLGFDIGI